MKTINNSRVIQHTPFCWQEKAVLRLIREHLDESSLLNSALAMYLVMSEIASNQQEEKFSVSLAVIAEMTGVSRRTVIRIMKEFENLEIINIKRRKAGNKNLTSIYTLVGGVSESLVSGMKTGKLAHNRRIKEESSEECVRTNALFDQFWSTYPKKKSKKAAQKAFVKLAPDENLFQQMMSALDKQCESAEWTNADGKYIPYAATWLNQARWEDELEESSHKYSSGVDWGALDL